MNVMALFALLLAIAAVIGCVIAIKKSVKADKRSTEADAKSIKTEQKAKDNQEKLIALAENDLSHIGESIGEIKDELKNIWTAINGNKTDIKELIGKVGELKGKTNSRG